MKRNVFFGIGGLLSGICTFVALCVTMVLFVAISCAWSLNPENAGNETMLDAISLGVAVLLVFAMLIGLIIGIRGFCGGRVAGFFVFFEIILHVALVGASIYFTIPEISVSAQLTGSFLFFIIFAVVNVINITLYAFGIVSKKKKEQAEVEQETEQPQENN